MFLPLSYGQTSDVPIELTGKQQVATKGIDAIGQGLQAFFGWKTAQTAAGMDPSGGGTYTTYAPPSSPQPAGVNTGLIVTAIIGTGAMLLVGYALLSKRDRK